MCGNAKKTAFGTLGISPTAFQPISLNKRRAIGGAILPPRLGTLSPKFLWVSRFNLATGVLFDVSFLDIKLCPYNYFSQFIDAS